MNALEFGTRMSRALCVSTIGIALSGGAAAQTSADTPPDASILVAQAAGPAPTQATAATSSDFPAYQRGVRAAAAQGPEALRRYVARTRMIYGFHYNDFAPKE